MKENTKVNMNQFPAVTMNQNTVNIQMITVFTKDKKIGIYQKYLHLDYKVFII